MPIYEFYCKHCNTIFSFLSRKIDTQSTPKCPSCGRKRDMTREVSAFAHLAGASEDADDPLANMDVDDTRMERAMEELAAQAESVDENDPKAAAALMRKFRDVSGLDFGDSMQEAIARLEAGEDPEAVEAELGEVLDNEDPFASPSKKARAPRRPPHRDQTLYEM